MLTGVHQEHIYIAIGYLHTHYGYSVLEICNAMKLNRSSYYKWKNRKPSKNEELNRQIAELAKENYENSDGVLGYRQKNEPRPEEENLFSPDLGLFIISTYSDNTFLKSATH